MGALHGPGLISVRLEEDQNLRFPRARRSEECRGSGVRLSREIGREHSPASTLRRDPRRDLRDRPMQASRHCVSGRVGRTHPVRLAPIESITACARRATTDHEDSSEIGTHARYAHPCRGSWGDASEILSLTACCMKSGEGQAPYALPLPLPPRDVPRSTFPTKGTSKSPPGAIFASPVEK